MRFVSHGEAPRNTIETDLWFVFQNGKLLVHTEDDTVSVPVARDLVTLNLGDADGVYVGNWGDAACFAVDVPEDLSWPHNMSVRPLRTVMDDLHSAHASLALRAAHMVHWRRTHRRCGRCGALLHDCDEERARRCPVCRQVCYPIISPAVIVAVVRDGRVLLVREPRFSSGLYSVIAGFVEPGESLEDCVRREVFEEVGVEVANIKYFGSQPWPFPDSLMMAFTAEYATGEIAIDQLEILEAHWFAPSELPRIPSHSTIARTLIDWFVKEYGNGAGTLRRLCIKQSSDHGPASALKKTEHPED